MEWKLTFQAQLLVNVNKIYICVGNQSWMLEQGLAKYCPQAGDSFLAFSEILDPFWRALNQALKIMSHVWKYSLSLLYLVFHPDI